MYKRGMRSLLLVVGLVVAACGGSSSPSPDGAGGGDGAAVADGAAGADGSTPTIDGALPTADASADEQLCTSMGGTVDTILCCGATPDLVDMCSIGPCGCAPASSHETRQCRCPEGTCFKPELGCVGD